MYKFRLINCRVTHLGISPRWLHELQQAKIKPREKVDLSSLQVVTSTGMVLRDALFEWFYDEGFPSHVRLNNISGGTDIAGCFGIGNPLAPLYVGGCAGCSLGIPVEVYDSTIEGGDEIKGEPVEEGVPGELVATSAFPNMPTLLWGDEGGKKYHDAYFGRFDSGPTPLFMCLLVWSLTIYRCVDTRRFRFHPSNHETDRVSRTRRWGPQPIGCAVWIGRDLSSTRGSIFERDC